MRKVLIANELKPLLVGTERYLDRTDISVFRGHER
jgi:hypothetical protein